MSDPAFAGTEPVSFQPVGADHAHELAELIYLCGPNLLSQAFGPSYDETIRCLALLAAKPMTMFSYQFARVAVCVEDSAHFAGIVIGLSYANYHESERRLAKLVLRQKGWWRWFGMLPLAAELSRCAEPLSPGSYYISALSVRDQWRRRGVGAALLDVSHQIALENGCRTVLLDVEMDNPIAQHLYERMGYSAVSECMAGPQMRRRGIVGLRRMKRQL
jgi:ribosomal protein S18 acetylase RimI-like enzyme